MRIILIGVAAFVALVILGFVALAFIGVVGGPGLLRARQEVNEASAIASLRTVLSAQFTYAGVCGQGSFAPTFDALVRPAPGSSMGYLTSDMSGSQSLVRSGYRFTMTGTVNADAGPSCNGVAAGQSLNSFAITAVPEADGGSRHFGTNADGIVYESPTPFGALDSGMTNGAKPLL